MKVLQKSQNSIFIWGFIVSCLVPLAAYSAPSKSYKDEYGNDCVHSVGNIANYPYKPTTDKGYIYFENRCSGNFIISSTLSSGRKVSNGISGKTENGPGTSHLACIRAAGECTRIEWEAN